MTTPDAALTFPCKNCGAKLQFDASSGAMACPFCGHKEAVQAPAPAAAAPAPAPGAAPMQVAAPPGQIREIPLEEGMRLAYRAYLDESKQAAE